VCGRDVEVHTLNVAAKIPEGTDFVSRFLLISFTRESRLGTNVIKRVRLISIPRVRFSKKKRRLRTADFQKRNPLQHRGHGLFWHVRVLNPSPYTRVSLDNYNYVRRGPIGKSRNGIDGARFLFALSAFTNVRSPRLVPLIGRPRFNTRITFNTIYTF